MAESPGGMRRRGKDAAPAKPDADQAAGSAGTSTKKPKRERSFIRTVLVFGVPAIVLMMMYEVIDVRAIWWWAMRAVAGPTMFTPEELSQGNTGTRPLLSILGEVFDVSKGARHYGSGGAYRGFTGKDGSRAFVTGDFSEEGFTDDLTGLTPEQCLGLEEWADFYRQETKYPAVGLVVGRMWDQRGKPTWEAEEFRACVEEGRKKRVEKAEHKKLYPSCNSRWTPQEGGRVWCGDEERVPRKVPDTPPKPEEEPDALKVKGRCACFEVEHALRNQRTLLVYPGCDPKSNSCVTKPPQQ